MSDYSNPNIGDVLPNVPAVGALAFNRSVFDFADADYKPASLLLADRIQIGVVPAGQVLVPHLTRAAIPAIEAGGPLSDYTIGTDTSPAILKGSTDSGVAQALSGEDWLVPATAIGHPTEDTPIYITIITANAAGPAAAGQIVFEPVTRAWRDELDA
jgi:hypothetical protein